MRACSRNTSGPLERHSRGKQKGENVVKIVLPSLQMTLAHLQKITSTSSHNRSFLSVKPVNHHHQVNMGVLLPDSTVPPGPLYNVVCILSEFFKDACEYEMCQTAERWWSDHKRATCLIEPLTSSLLMGTDGCRRFPISRRYSNRSSSSVTLSLSVFPMASSTNSRTFLIWVTVRVLHAKTQ